MLKQLFTAHFNLYVNFLPHRDEANSKAAALRDRNAKESVAHMTELKDLLRTLDHDHKLKEFMSTKAHERQIEEDEEKLKKKGECL